MIVLNKDVEYEEAVLIMQLKEAGIITVEEARELIVREG